MPLPTRSQQSAWRGLFRACTRARHEAEAALKHAGFPPLEVYDVLLELDRSKARHGLTAKLLQDRLLLPQYGVSRLLDRLENQGLIERLANPADRRSSLIAITADGRSLRREMWKVYGAVIGDFIGLRLRSDQADELGELLRLLSGEAP